MKVFHGFSFQSTLPVVIVVFALLLSCTSDEEKKIGHYDRGIKYVAEEKYDEALLEFRNVIQLDPSHADAKYQLGLIYMEKGGLANLRNAFKVFNEAVAVKPELIDAQVRLGVFYLLSNAPEKAKEKAELALAKEPDNKEAHQILAGVYIKNEQFADAEKKYEEILKLDPVNPDTYYALSELYLKRKAFKEAEALLEKARSIDTTDAKPHIALARFYQITDQKKKAENLYKKAVVLSPKEKSLYFSLAGFYRSVERFDDAEQALDKASKIDLNDFEPFIMLGDFYAFRGRLKESEAAFVKAKGLESKGHIGHKRLVRLYLTQGRKDDIQVIIEEILDAAPKDPDALFFKGRLRLSERKGTEAIDLFRQVTQVNRSYPGVHYYLGLAHLLGGEGKQARSAFIEAVKLQPENHLAHLALADIYFRSRSFDLVIEEVEAVLKKDSSNARAYILRGDTALATGDIKKGEDNYQKAVKFSPENPVPYFRLGLLRRAKKKDTKAEHLFEKALSFNPNMIDALSQIVSIKLKKGDLSGALKRVTAQIQSVPENSAFRRLRGGLYAAKKERSKAIAEFKAAIEINPNDLAAYLDLGNIYSLHREYEQALKELDDGIKVNPNVVQVYMLKGVIYDTQHQYEKAQIAYEKALKIDSKFAPAANNLAWIYAEHGGNIDKALSLAQIAKERLPDDPGISDTLGWIYYKKNVFLKAISLLRGSAEKLSKNPVVRYHLGMAYAKEGKADLARIELNAALKLDRRFPGAEEAEKTLKEL